MRYLLILAFLFSFAISDNLSARLDKLIQDKRLKTVTIVKYNPFYTKKQEKQIKKKEIYRKKPIKKQKLRLITILNGKAFVNGRWLERNDVIFGFTVKKISNDRVIFIKKNRSTILRFEKTKKIIKVKE